MRTLSNSITLSVFMIPFVLSLVGVIKGSLMLLALALLLMFAIVFIAPVSRTRENLFIYCEVALTLVPVNVKLAKIVGFEYFDGKLFAFFAIIVIFSILFSVEEIIFGLITRLIRPSQEDFDLI